MKRNALLSLGRAIRESNITALSLEEKVEVNEVRHSSALVEMVCEAISVNSKVERLHLALDFPTSDFVNFCLALSHSKINTLGLELLLFGHVDFHGWLAFSESISQAGVTHLSLCDRGRCTVYVDRFFTELLHRVICCPQLRHFSLSGHSFGRRENGVLLQGLSQEQWELIFSALRESHLVSMSLSQPGLGYSVSPDWWQRLSELIAECPDLKFIDLSHCALNGLHRGEKWRSFIDFVHNCQISLGLTIDEILIECNSMEVIEFFNVVNQSNIQSLNLNGDLILNNCNQWEFFLYFIRNSKMPITVECQNLDLIFNHERWPKFCEALSASHITSFQIKSEHSEDEKYRPYWVELHKIWERNVRKCYPLSGLIMHSLWKQGAVLEKDQNNRTSICLPNGFQSKSVVLTEEVTQLLQEGGGIKTTEDGVKFVVPPCQLRF